jgi:hypothetical protein
MTTCTFPASGLIRPSGPAIAGTAVVEESPRVTGDVTFRDTSLTLNGEEIPYSRLKSAAMQVQYGPLGGATYTLVFTDGEYNFLLHIPRKEAERLPMPVTIAGRRSLLRRYWYAVLMGLTFVLMFIGELLR